ncbi:MAG: cytochrome c assembly protein [Bacteroidetes bacterium]|nr:MAG: cytochrome c assembly protein [Bacteroidota bacterium]
MDYIGEHLLPGQLGHFFVVLSLVASLVAFVSNFKSSQAIDPNLQWQWKKLARIAFGIDVLAVFSVFATVYYIVYHHRFEYNFAWEHSNLALSPKFLLACIWEAQEGSFLLWTMWHCVLGIILIFRAGKWEAPVMTIMSFVQICLATMILGIYFFGAKVGNSPFLLVRHLFTDAPIFQRADYLSIPQMQDGQGLNALLQNYWMVIHPPVLFLGFASTIVPFAYAFAGLWKKDYSGWTRVALPWTLFSACVLGTGIMMGAAWAYESLSFGGYWAWDPVENASLVPWLVLVAGLHTQVIFNATGHSLRATYLFLLLGFILILYSTFLTRSGVLGDTSVHAFVDSGMNIQLMLFIFVFLIPAAIVYISRYKSIPHIDKEENTYSREFWMFIGSLVIFLSSIFVIIATSLPVINKITGTKWSTGDDSEFAYNRIEIFIAIILGLLTGITQYLKYKQTSKEYFFKKIWLPALISVIIASLISIFGKIQYDKYGGGFLIAIHLGLFCAIFSVVANAGYIWAGLKGKWKAAGASIAHVGFGLMLVGILISSSKKQVLSYNTTGININFDPSAKQNPLENITLLKNVQTDMGRYWATYVSNDSLNESGTTTYFKIHMQDKRSKEEFNLYPFLIKATKGQQGFAFNPSKHHYWDRDIFSYISAVDNGENDTTSFKSHPVSVHDTVFYSKGYMILDKIEANPNNSRYHFTSQDTAIVANIRIISRDSLQYNAMPALFIKNNQSNFITDTVFTQNLVLGIGSLLPDHKIELRVKESSDMIPFVALKVYEFPHINILWLGTLIMIIGFVMSIVRRIRTRLTVA